MRTLDKLDFDLLPHPQHSSDLVDGDYWFFADVKRMLQEKRFGSSARVIAATEAYFETNDTFFKKQQRNRKV